MGVSVGDNEDGRVEVIGIDEGSPAELAKIKEGDILLKLGDKDVAGGQMLSSEIRKRKPGDDVVLKVERDGKPMDIKVKLGEYPEGQAKREMELKFPGLFSPDAQMAIPPGVLRPKVPRDFMVPKGKPLVWEKTKFIGVYLDELNEELSGFFGIKEGTGLLVNKLTENGPAEKAGIKVGDVIVKADGKRVEHVAELSRVVQDKEKGEKVKLDVLRDKKALAFEVAIDEDESGDLMTWVTPGTEDEISALKESRRPGTKWTKTPARRLLRTLRSGVTRI